MEYYFGEKEVPYFFFSTRFGIAVLAFFGFLAMNSQRVVMDLALPCMINHTAVHEIYILEDVYDQIESLPKQMQRQKQQQFLIESTTPYSNTSQYGYDNSTSNNSSDPKDTLYNTGASLDKKCDGAAVELDILKLSLNFTYSTKTGELVWPLTRQVVLSRTFYWGYVVGFLPFGWLSERIGGKFVLGGAIMAMSSTTSLISLSTSTHYFVLILLRFIAGMGAGACLPAMHAIWGKWAPPLERSSLTAITYSGIYVGRSFTFPLVGALCQYGFLGGWPSVFYTLGAYGFLWSIIWMIFTKNFPSQHGRLGYNEKKYLQATLQRETIVEPRTDISVPCFAVITSLPFISVIVSHFTFVWTLHAYETYIPIYFSDIHEYEYRENGFFNMIPYLAIMVFMILSGWWADQLRSRGVMGATAVRKIMNTVGASVPAAMLIGLGFINCKQWIGAVCMLTLGMSCLGFQGSGFMINHLDLAPQYAGFLMGVSGCLGSLAQFLQPFLVETITPEKTHEQWQTFFFISGCLGGGGALVFLLCGSGEVQTWARVPGYNPGTTSADYSTQSSMQSILVDDIAKSNKKINFINSQPHHYATLDERKMSHMLTRSLSEDDNKRFSVQSNLYGYDDPYFFRSLDRKGSQKKIKLNPSYHSLEYPSRRLTKSFDIETNLTPKGKSLQEEAIMEILSNDSKDELNQNDGSLTDLSKITKKKPSIEKKRPKSTSQPVIHYIGENHITNNQINKPKSKKLSTVSRLSDTEDTTTTAAPRARKISTVTKPIIQEDPPSADKPSSSSADSSKRGSKKKSRKKSKGSLNAIQNKDIYDKISESKV